MAKVSRSGREGDMGRGGGGGGRGRVLEERVYEVQEVVGRGGGMVGGRGGGEGGRAWQV